MSGGYVWYHQRPNKAVERQLFVELLIKLNRFMPISDYCYISFGGAYLEDFKLIHSYFANRKMISIESDEIVYNRQLFNIPYSCISSELCASGEFISERLDTSINNIVWLDYADASGHQEQLNEFQTLLAKLKLYDIVKITLNANPSSLFDGNQKKIIEGVATPYLQNEIQDKRLTKLQEKIGNFLPNDIVKENITKDGYPLVLNRAIGVAASQITTVNANFRFQPLTSFYYGDSDNQMMTLTGMILNASEIDDVVKTTGLDSWDLATLNWGLSNLIHLPSLTAKEKFTLDQNIPCEDSAVLSEALQFKFDKKLNLHNEMLANYKKYYRQYPSYHKINY